jgi:hypothetical protein
MQINKQKGKTPLLFGEKMNVGEIFSIVGSMIGLSSIVYLIFKIKNDHEEEFKRLHKRIENQENRMFQLALGKISVQEALEGLIKEKKEEMAKNDVAVKLNQQAGKKK